MRQKVGNEHVHYENGHREHQGQAIIPSKKQRNPSTHNRPAYSVHPICITPDFGQKLDYNAGGQDFCHADALGKPLRLYPTFNLVL